MFQENKQKYSAGFSVSVRYNVTEGDVAMYENEFARRLSQLRAKRGISAVI